MNGIGGLTEEGDNGIQLQSQQPAVTLGTDLVRDNMEQRNYGNLIEEWPGVILWCGMKII